MDQPSSTVAKDAAVSLEVEDPHVGDLEVEVEVDEPHFVGLPVPQDDLDEIFAIWGRDGEFDMESFATDFQRDAEAIAAAVLPVVPPVQEVVPAVQEVVAPLEEAPVVAPVQEPLRQSRYGRRLRRNVRHKDFMGEHY